MAPRKKIAADGSIVSEDENGAASASSGSCLSGSSGGSLSSVRNVDVFGFNLDPKHFMVVLALVALMLGTKGLIAFLVALGAYTMFQRATGGDGETPAGGSGDAGRGGWGGGGANIRGVKDLPKPPPRG